MSIAVWIGLIALMGVDAETGVFMLLYLDLAHARAEKEGRLRSQAELREAILQGVVRRIRPKFMTVLCMLLAAFSHKAQINVLIRTFWMTLLLCDAICARRFGGWRVRATVAIVLGRSLPVDFENETRSWFGSSFFVQQRSAAQAETKMFFQGYAFV